MEGVTKAEVSVEELDAIESAMKAENRFYIESMTISGIRHVGVGDENALPPDQLIHAIYVVKTGALIV